MGRNWIPKYACTCKECGWKGTRGHVSKACPRCGLKRVEKDPPKS